MAGTDTALADDKPAGITCEQYVRAEGKRCRHYLPNGACSLPGEFMCSEWLKKNGQRPPPAKDLFGNPLADQPAKKAAKPPTADKPAVAADGASRGLLHTDPLVCTGRRVVADCGIPPARQGSVTVTRAPGSVTGRHLHERPVGRAGLPPAVVAPTR